MRMSNKVYDILKFIQFLVPIIVAFLAGLVLLIDQVWGWPAGASIAAFITGLGTLITAAVGSLLKWSSYVYKKDQDTIDAGKGEDE